MKNLFCDIKELKLEKVFEANDLDVNDNSVKELISETIF